MILNKRQSLILKEIVCNPGIAPETLAYNVNISTRTLTSDMETINKEIKVFDLRLENRRGNGLFCFGEDEHKLHYIKSQLILRYCYAFDHENDFSERTGDVIRILLLSGDYVKSEEIANALWLTRSSINQELKEVRKIIKRYNMELETKPHHGMMIRGEESTIRQCMVDFCKPYSHAIVPIVFLDDGYTRYGIPHDEIKNCYHLMVQTFTKMDLRCSEQALERLAILAFIMKQRIEEKNYISINETLASGKQLHKTPAYYASSQILNTVCPHIPEVVKGDEILFFAMMILANADFYHTPSHLLTDYGQLYQRALSYHDQLQTFFRSQLSIVFSGDSQFSHCLTKLIFQFLIRKELQITEFEYGGSAYKYATLIPASRQLACETLMELEKISGYPADQYMLINFTLLFYNTVMVIPSNRKKLRMLCVGPHNLHYARSISYKIKSQHENYIDSIDHCTPYELNHMDLRKYDCIITSEPIELLPKQDILPVMELSYFLSWKELYDIRNQVILPHISTETMLSEVQHVEELDLPCKNSKEFVQWAITKTDRSPHEKGLLEMYHEYLPVYPADTNSSDSIMPVFCSFLPPDNKWSIQVYRFKQPFVCNGKTIINGVICSIPLNFDTQVVKQADSLLRRIMLSANFNPNKKKPLLDKLIL
ncbi:lichenan operon transcriptional antiterminator [Aequitasia blattaphilus]